jgi:hypothetical protein
VIGGKVERHNCRYSNTRKIHPPHYAVRSQVSLTKTRGELKGSNEKCSESSQHVGQERPPHWIVVRPLFIGMIEDEKFVMPENKKKHHQQRTEHYMPQPDLLVAGENGEGWRGFSMATTVAEWVNLR